jgi:hypothetical protein
LDIELQTNFSLHILIIFMKFKWWFTSKQNKKRRDRMPQKIYLFTWILIFNIVSVKFGTAQNNLPRSKEAIYVESYSNSEVSIYAKGIGIDEDDPIGDAENDARKAAVYFLLYMANEPLLQDKSEKDAFLKIENNFFNINIINNFISYMGNDLISRVRLKDGIKVEKHIRVNKLKLIEYLTSQGVLIAREQLEEIFDNPIIMVIPETVNGESSIEKLKTNSLLKKGAEVIESYLTSRSYEVKVPEQQNVLEKYVTAHEEIADIEQDYAYQLALSIGSDIYITYNIHLEKQKFGTKAIAGCRAYETTTGRLLGSETGYTPARPLASKISLIEEAVGNAIDNVLSRIVKYWKKDFKKGIQYKLVVSITSDYDEDQITEIHFAFDSILGTIANKTKENIITKQKMDYIIWCDPERYSSAQKVYRRLKKEFNRKQLGLLKYINNNRRLLLLKIESK